MNRESIREYVACQRERYRNAGRKEKGKILDEVQAVTGYHRKAAVRLLSGKRRTAGAVRSPGRPMVYGPEVAAAARTVYEAAGGIGAKRLRPFIPELVARLEAFGELRLSAEASILLRRASPATLDRLLAPDRTTMRKRARSLTKPGTVLRQRIPVRTFSEWDDVPPGFVEVDTVAHGGDNAEGFYLWTVNAVDIATGWVEMDVVWGKTQVRVGAAIQRIRRRLPVPLLGLDSDNGGEFINHGLYEYCQTHGITFTRSRAYKKNDNAHVEQKNGAVVRRLVGYGRYMSAEAFAQLRRVYALARLHVNFFQPVMKLAGKSREGGKSRRLYDEAKTPYQRMVESGKLSGAREAVLEKLYLSLNPLHLSRELDRETRKLLLMAAGPGDRLSWSGKGNRNSEAANHLW